MMRKFVIIALLFTGISAHAQIEQQLLPAERKQQTLITQPVTLYKGFFRVGVGTEYIITNTLFNDDGERQELFNGIGDRWNINPTIEYGITDRLQAKVMMPYTITKVSASVVFEAAFDGSSQAIQREATSIGFMDLMVELACQVLTESETRPSLLFSLNTSIPTGEKDVKDTGKPRETEIPTGNGNFRITGLLNVRKVNYPFLYSGTVSYLYQLEGSKVFVAGTPEIDFKDADILEINGEFGFHVNEWMAIVNRIRYGSTIGDLQREGESIDSNPAWAIGYLPTLTFQVKRLRISQFLTFPIAGRNFTADPRFELAVQYVF